MPGFYVAPPRPRLPDESSVDFADPVAVKRYIQSLNAALVQQLAVRQVQQQAVAARMFLSPNGTAYEMTVSDAGAPVFTKKADPKP